MRSAILQWLLSANLLVRLPSTAFPLVKHMLGALRPASRRS